MDFRLSPSEWLARARADMRMGVPVLLKSGDATVIAAAAETLTQARFEAIRCLGGSAVLAVTSRRAGTLKAAAYDGDLARFQLPADATAAWVWSTADPASDLSAPMKGPFRAARGATWHCIVRSCNWPRMRGSCQRRWWSRQTTWPEIRVT